VVPASSWIAKIPQSMPTLIERLSFVQRPIKFLASSKESVGYVRLR
jgi:hypothetical protein